MTPIIPNMTDYESVPMLREAVEQAKSACQIPFQPDPVKMVEENGQAVQDTLDAMGVEACKYNKSDVKAAAAACYFPVGCGGAATQVTKQNSVGCEQINVVSNMVNQTTNQVSCLLNQSSSTSTTNIVSNQVINVKFGGDLEEGCNLNLTNKQSLKVQILNLNQSSVQSAISKTIKQGMQDSLTSDMATKNEAFSDPASQKLVKTLTSNLTSNSMDNQIQQSVATTVANIYSNQEINLEVRGSCKNATVNLTNENAIDLLAQTFVYNAVDQILQTDFMQDAITDVKSTFAQENQGVSNLFSSLGFMMGTGVLVILIICVIVYMIIKNMSTSLPIKSLPLGSIKKL